MRGDSGTVWRVSGAGDRHAPSPAHGDGGCVRQAHVAARDREREVIEQWVASIQFSCCKERMCCGVS
jgi:hypothetical protein